jgi:hypothetical protein
VGGGIQDPTRHCGHQWPIVPAPGDYNDGKLVQWLAGETEVLWENLPQCRFVHHKSDMLAGREPGPPRWEASDWRWATARPGALRLYLAYRLWDLKFSLWWWFRLCWIWRSQDADCEQDCFLGCGALQSHESSPALTSQKMLFPRFERWVFTPMENTRCISSLAQGNWIICLLIFLPSGFRNLWLVCNFAFRF